MEDQMTIIRSSWIPRSNPKKIPNRNRNINRKRDRNMNRNRNRNSSN
jgi:hypothetical protein